MILLAFVGMLIAISLGLLGFGLWYFPPEQVNVAFLGQMLMVVGVLFVIVCCCLMHLIWKEAR